MTTAILYHLKSLLFVAIGICGIGLLIGLHEFGHYLFARLFGVRAPSFSIGMGPKLFSKKIAGTEFKISAIPLGGYVEIAGMAEVGQGEQKEAYAIDKGSFQSKPYWQKALILMGGIIFNFLLAYLIFVGLYFTGMPKSLLFSPGETKPIISNMVQTGLAYQSNLAPGDEIIAINKQKTPNVLAVIKKLQKNANKSITIQIKREHDIIKKEIRLDKTGRLGIEFKAGYFPPLPLLNSIKKAWNATWEITKRTGEVFINLFKKRTMEGVGGPLFLISQIIANAKQGASIFLFLLAFISINLAIINLIPLPITDGGQLVFTTIEAIIRRPIPENIRAAIHNISWILVLVLFAYLTIKDTKMLFWHKIKNLFGK